MAGPNLADPSRPGAAGRAPSVYRVTLVELRGHRGIVPVAATFRVLAGLDAGVGLEHGCQVFALPQVHNPVSRTRAAKEQAALF